MCTTASVDPMGQQECRDWHQSSTGPHTSDTQSPVEQPKEPILPSQGVQTSNAQGGWPQSGFPSPKTRLCVLFWCTPIQQWVWWARLGWPELYVFGRARPGKEKNHRYWGWYLTTKHHNTTNWRPWIYKVTGQTHWPDSQSILWAHKMDWLPALSMVNPRYYNCKWSLYRHFMHTRLLIVDFMIIMSILTFKMEVHK